MTPELHPEFLNRITAINWFSRCGEKDDLNLRIPYRYVNSWKEAQKLYRHRDWEKIQMLGQNSITGYLYDHYPQAYDKDWNPLVTQAREFISSMVTPKAQEFMERNSLCEVFVHSVQWDVLHIIMEDAFREADLPVRFFSELLTLYEKGHFPCGWAGGDWYSGQLAVI